MYIVTKYNKIRQYHFIESTLQINYYIRRIIIYNYYIVVYSIFISKVKYRVDLRSFRFYKDLRLWQKGNIGTKPLSSCGSANTLKLKISPQVRIDAFRQLYSKASS